MSWYLVKHRDEFKFIINEEKSQWHTLPYVFVPCLRQAMVISGQQQEPCPNEVNFQISSLQSSCVSVLLVACERVYICSEQFHAELHFKLF